ncbi:MAG: hypothetical protein IT432_09640 [Phycisphaerales bacterium]|nr:hypothetical protein [Phycisphaerales bacterium]
MGFAGTKAAIPATIDVASALIDALHWHSPGPHATHGASAASRSSCNSVWAFDSSASAGDQTPPTEQARSQSQAQVARRSDHRPPSPGAGENSWRYSP